MHQLRRSENVPPAAAIPPYHLHSRIVTDGLKRNALCIRQVRWDVPGRFDYVR